MIGRNEERERKTGAISMYCRETEMKCAGLELVIGVSWSSKEFVSFNLLT